MRVEGIERLVSWLLDGNSRDENRWTLGAVNHMKQTREQRDVRLRSAVTVHFAYLTAWTNAEGDVNFRSDLYGHDRQHGVSRTASAY